MSSDLLREIAATQSDLRGMRALARAEAMPSDKGAVSAIMAETRALLLRLTPETDADTLKDIQQAAGQLGEIVQTLLAKKGAVQKERNARAELFVAGDLVWCRNDPAIVRDVTQGGKRKRIMLVLYDGSKTSVEPQTVRIRNTADAAEMDQWYSRTRCLMERRDRIDNWLQDRASIRQWLQTAVEEDGPAKSALDAAVTQLTPFWRADIPMRDAILEAAATNADGDRKQVGKLLRQVIGHRGDDEFTESTHCVAARLIENGRAAVFAASRH